MTILNKDRIYTYCPRVFLILSLEALLMGAVLLIYLNQNAQDNDT